jgi:hypothetical protein
MRRLQQGSTVSSLARARVFVLEFILAYDGDALVFIHTVR